MGKNLVVVESPAKAKTINKILGSDFIVKASMGHVRDLPEKDFGIDIENGFKPKYVTLKSRSKILKELKEAAAKADGIYLAPDPDREGEAIAWHLMAALKGKTADDHFYRVTYNEITAPAIRKAFSEPGRIDLNKVDSQQARRILDRLVGYKVSPLLWRRIRGASSAGRVQSVALRLVCEREHEIDVFVPEEYWILGVKARKFVDPRDPFMLKLAKIDGEKAEVKSGEQAEGVRTDLEGRELIVSNILTKTVSKRAMPPYITSSLQQAGSSVFGFAPSVTMRIAQKLYEGIDFGEGPVGLITYMRTDSFNIAQSAREQCGHFIRDTFGQEFLPEKPNFYKSRGSAQEAHEAIRPTDVNRTPKQLESVLDSQQLRLYRLIWQRFVASQMAPAKIAQRTVEVEAMPTSEKPTPYLFRATASEVVFPGYMKVTGAEQKKKSENGEEVEKLPPLEKGEKIEWLEWDQQQKFTQPPPRYTEASLVRAMEENGVGRPSTYAQILSTLQARKYVEKEKRSLKPTEIGLKVCDFLVQNLAPLFDVKFTAQMEESLDKIEQGSVKWVSMMEDFYKDLSVWLEKAKGPQADPELMTRLFGLFDQVKEWAPETKRGKRTYSDKKFIESIQKQMESGKPIYMRQCDAVKKVLCKYRDQIPAVREDTEALGLTEQLKEAEKPQEPPRPETIRKLDLLGHVKCDEPRTVGKRTYDDRAFIDSLRERADSGRQLTPNQIRYLDRLVRKYSDQIEGFEALAPELGMDTVTEDKESGPLIELLKQIKEWKPPVQRGKREWDDRKFYESLAKQFEQKKQLSPKQVLSLKKMIGRYAAQIPDFERVVEQYGIPQKKKKSTGKTAS